MYKKESRSTVRGDRTMGQMYGSHYGKATRPKMVPHSYLLHCLKSQRPAARNSSIVIVYTMYYY
jgi:hypothetical protein